MAEEPGFPASHAGAPRADGTQPLHRRAIFPPRLVKGATTVCCLLNSAGPPPFFFLQVMCVLMVCFNVLELLLDEKAMPMGMEVSI